jgi:AcrR family transcriptional regulator
MSTRAAAGAATITAMTEQRLYRGIAADERRSQRRARLLDAALDILAEGGLPALGVRAVCARAQLTSRYFYESFEDLDALMVALADEIAAEILGEVRRAVDAAPADAYEKSRAAIDAALDVITGDPRKGKVVLLSVAGHETLQRRYHDVVLRYAEVVSQQGREFFGPGRLSAADAELTALFAVGGAGELLIAWLTGTLDVSRERLVDHGARLFAACASVRSG